MCFHVIFETIMSIYARGEYSSQFVEFNYNIKYFVEFILKNVVPKTNFQIWLFK